MAALVTPASYLSDIPPATAEGKSGLPDVMKPVMGAHKPRFGEISADVGLVQGGMPMGLKPCLVGHTDVAPTVPQTSRDSAAVPDETRGRPAFTETEKVPLQVATDDGDIPEEAPLVIDQDPPCHNQVSLPVHEGLPAATTLDGKPKRGKGRGRKPTNSSDDIPRVGTEPATE